MCAVQRLCSAFIKGAAEESLGKEQQLAEPDRQVSSSFLHHAWVMGQRLRS